MTIENIQIKHGTATAYITHKCRCFTCRVYNSNRKATYRRKQLYGVESYFVDAAPVAARLRQLIKNGAEIRVLARKLDIGRTTLHDLAYGRPKSRRYDRPKWKKQVARHVADKIMAVKAADFETFSRYVDADRVRKRVQALMALGYSRSFIANEIGMTSASFNVKLHSAQVFHATFEAIDYVYKKYEMTPRQSNDPRIQNSINRAKNEAAANGWLIPMAYDNIDTSRRKFENEIEKKGA